MKVAAAGLSDVGRRRETNEDELFLDSSGAYGVFAVADGMGGHAAGEVASRLAIETLIEGMRPGDGRAAPPGAAEASRLLVQAVEEANRRICESIVEREERRGMGTTMVAAVVLGDRAVIAHVGDSRAYLLRAGAIRRLTTDHSWVSEQVRMGLMTDDAAQRHPMRNIVTRALGSRSDVAVDLVEEPLEAGDTLLLCSDGLNSMLTDDEIGAVLVRHGTDPDAACRALVAAANERGGDDNTTVIVVRIR
jgi:protein phosphatase